MSRALFSLNPDLARLRSEGYFMRIQGSLLVMLEVPYLDAQRQVVGRLVAIGRILVRLGFGGHG